MLAELLISSNLHLCPVTLGQPLRCEYSKAYKLFDLGSTAVWDIEFYLDPFLLFRRLTEKAM